MKTPRFACQLSLALMLLSLAGCDANSLMSALPETSIQGSDQGLIFGPGSNGANGAPGMGGGDVLGLDRYMAGLNLSADQKTRLQALAAKYAPAQPGGPGASGGQPGTQPDAQPAGTNLQALLVATSFDADAVRQALSLQTQAPQGGPDRVALLQGYYELLTETQRNALADALLAAPQQPAGAWQGGDARPGFAPAPTVTMPQGVTLTDAQQAAFDAFKAQLAANQPAEQPEPVDPGAQMDAIAAYFESGDLTALQSALGGNASPQASFPVDAFIALASSLSVDQRKLFFAQGVPGLPGGPGGMNRPAPGAPQA